MEQIGLLNNDFRTCLATLMQHGLNSHPRPGTALGKTKEVLNYNITLQSPLNRVITFPDRRTNLEYLIGEFVWYLEATNTVDGILPYSKFWGNIKNTGEQDGYPKDTINSNYGNRIFGMAEPAAFWEGNIQPINQWDETVALLSRDKETRQAVMNIHVPSDRHAGNIDVPCTLTLQWLIRENALHLIVNMRSNDVILGFTNDVFQFTMLQEAMQVQLKEVYPELQLGHYFHNTGSMHIYDRHFEMATKIIADDNVIDIKMIPMDRFDTDTIKNLIAVKKHLEENPDDGHPEAFTNLSPYWQTVVMALFFDNEIALHDLFLHDH